MLIRWHLAHSSKHRHVELKRRLSGITDKVLTQQLREMERDGLIERQVFAEIPPRVEYQLTALGKSLQPIIDAMYVWGMNHIESGNNGTSCSASVHGNKITAGQLSAAERRA
jgi:DNA-binding HxlR family transcriptional regulator